MPWLSTMATSALRLVQGRSTAQNERERLIGVAIIVALSVWQVGLATPDGERDDEVIQTRHDVSQVTNLQLRVVLVQGDIAPVMGTALNGLITNNKFCMSRTAQLVRLRRNPKSRCDDLASNDTALPARDTLRHGGLRETRVEGTSGTAGEHRRAAAMGSDLPTVAGMVRSSRTGTRAAIGCPSDTTTGG